MSKKTKFIIRLFSWLSIAFVAPITFMLIRFEMFEKVTNVSVGGWGLIFILFITIFIIYALRMIEEGFVVGVVKQSIRGVRKIILPLIMLILGLYWLKDCLPQLMEFLIFIVICETVALPINPLPSWLFEKGIEVSAFKIKSIFDYLKEKK
jgi:hypothetical protein